jgi:cation/acetate symporter
VISGLFAAGAIAAAISTASALLVTMSTSLSHDLYYRLLNPRALPARRLQMSRLLIIAVAAVSAWAASLRPAELLIMVSWSFSLAASSLFSPLVLGIWWRRTSTVGAITGMIAGFAVCLLYLVVTRHFPEFGVNALGMTAFVDPITGAPLVDVSQVAGRPDATLRLANKVGWLNIWPISAAVFGVPVALVATVLVSHITWRPSATAEAILDHLRNPEAPARADDASETSRLN